MRKKFGAILGLALVIGQSTAFASTTSVSSVPQGMITVSAAKGTTTYFSVPLSNDAVYTGTVGAVGANSITVTDAPSPFTLNFGTAGSPFFLKFLTGSETGRTLLITSNSWTELTVNTADGVAEPLSLLTSGYSVRPGDVFEIFAGDTLASIFGSNTSRSPLAISGGSSFASSDKVSVYNGATSRWQPYYFNTTVNHWLAVGSSANADDTVLRPYSGLSVTRLATRESTASLVISGRVAEVPVVTRTTGKNAVVYGSTGYAVGMTLSQLNFGSNWVKGTTAATADVVSIWNSASKRFLSYYQTPDSVWHESGNATSNEGTLAIAAGSCIGIEQHMAVTGATAYLPLAMPYTLSNY
jgi:uncharacterized protein (TIGR02597 family)